MTVTDAVPVFDRVKVQVGLATSGVAPHETTAAVTVADLVNVPNRPNTKPAIAIAAMSVIAISMTVASTGLIALRLFLSRRFMMFYS